MGFWRSLLHGETLATASDAVGPAFSSVIDPGTLGGFSSVDEAIRYLGSGGPVTRDVAIRIPAVKKSRDLIAGGLGQLPLQLHGPTGAPEPWSLFDQPEDGRAPSITWTWVVDDLIFEAKALLRVTHFGWHGRPAEVERIKPGAYTRAKGGLWVNRTGKPAIWVPSAHVIEIESPNDALLTAGARAIRILARLDTAALNAVDGVPMTDFFTPADPNVDPFDGDDDDAQAFLDSWTSARAKRSTGYVPAALKYQTNGFNPEQLQLAEARTFAIAEIARCTGVDPEELGISTTSRTYFNAQDRRRHRSDNILGPYRRAVEGRLSMADVTPHGYYARFDLAEAERADDLTAAQTDAALLTAGILDVDEVRARRNLPPRPTVAAPAEQPTPQESNA